MVAGAPGHTILGIPRLSAENVDIGEDDVVNSVKGSSGEHENDDSADENSKLQVSPSKSPAKPAATIDIEPRIGGVPVKWISLAALTVQTSGQALLIKWSRGETGKAPYLSSTVVCLTEIVKTTTSLALVVIECGSLTLAAQSVHEHFTSNSCEVLKAAVPSLIYTIQNNLMFYSFDKLSAPVQQVLYQMKILTTAGLSVVMLGKTLTATQWSACLMLTIGVALVQWPRQTYGHQNKSPPDSVIFSLGGDEVKGFIAVLLACLTSGFAAVYIQKMLQQTSASIWMRNVQFGFFGSLMGLLVALGQDGEKIQKDGFTQGYSVRVVLVILMNALGGLLCAAMLKFAGATLGCFSTAISIVLTCILSATLLQDFIPDELFVLGTLLTVAASMLYGLGLPDKVYTILKYILEPPGKTPGDLPRWKLEKERKSPTSAVTRPSPT